MRGSLAHILSRLALACAFLVSGGCAVVRTVHQNGDTSISLAPIAATMSAEADARAVYVSGVGLAVGPETSALGAFDLRYVRIDPSCRLVVMVENATDVDRLASLIREHPDICMTR
jgi:hypothetical protein